jgi:type VI secretion system protein ImpK
MGVAAALENAGVPTASGTPGLADIVLAPLRLASGNPLLEAAAPILGLIARIRGAEAVDAAALGKRVVADIQRFEDRARTLGVPVESIRIVRFALCATIDDIVSHTPWTPGAAWSVVLATVLTEGAESERFFDTLETLRGRPAAHIDELEVMYLCLALGFEGKYRNQEGGRSELNRLRDQTFRQFRQFRDVQGQALAPFPEPPKRRLPALGSIIPLRTIALAGLVILAVIFAVLRYTLDSVSGPVHGRLTVAFPASAVTMEAREDATPPSETPKVERIEVLKTALRADIDARLIDIVPAADRIIVRLVAPALFATNSATLNDRLLPLVDRVGEALGAFDGTASIVGHTDSTPVRTARFPNNTLLSLARAGAVHQRLAPKLGARWDLATEGRGDADPIASNATATGRERNRRIDIVIEPGRPE